MDSASAVAKPGMAMSVNDEAIVVMEIAMAGPYLLLMLKKPMPRNRYSMPNQKAKHEK
jgi:hypothetical protein